MEKKKATKSKKGTSENGQKPRLPCYGDEAALKLINLLYDPLAVEMCKESGIADEANLLSLTRINSSREALYWAMHITREAATSTTRVWPLSRIFRVAFLLARRSLGMRAFTLGAGLAEEQTVASEEKAAEEAELGEL